VRLDRAATLLIDSCRSLHAPSREVPAIPVLMYHSISDDDESGVHPYYRVATSPARFREHMEWLATDGYNAIGLEEAISRTSARRPVGRAVVVTFDDGLVDFLEHAWPTLESHGFTATMFLPTAFIGHVRRRFKDKECLTWSEVRDLSGRGARFGSHTVTHRLLRELPWTEVCAELRDSRHEIEAEIGQAVVTFAYPYAYPQTDRDFLARLNDELRGQQYRAAVTTAVGRLKEGDNPLSIKRLPLNSCDDLTLFRAKLTGAYDWVGTMQAVWKSGQRSVRGAAGWVRPS